MVITQLQFNKAMTEINEACVSMHNRIEALEAALKEAKPAPKKEAAKKA